MPRFASFKKRSNFASGCIFVGEQIQRLRDARGCLPALDGGKWKAMQNYGISQEDFASEEAVLEKIKQVRIMIVKSPAVSGDSLLAISFCSETLLPPLEIDGKSIVDYLWEEKRISTFASIQPGLEAEANGVELLKPIPGFSRDLAALKSARVLGVSLRTTIRAADAAGIEAAVGQLFELGAEILQEGLVPLLTPEIHYKCIDKEEAEDMLLKELLKRLDSLLPGHRVILRLALPEEVDVYRPLVNHHGVLRICAMPGDNDLLDACSALARHHGIIAGYNRPFVEGLSAGCDGDEVNRILEQNIRTMYRASCTVTCKDALLKFAEDTANLVFTGSRTTLQQLLEANAGLEGWTEAILCHVGDLLHEMDIDVDVVHVESFVLDSHLSPFVQCVVDNFTVDHPELLEDPDVHTVEDLLLHSFRSSDCATDARLTSIPAALKGGTVELRSLRKGSCEANEINTESFEELHLPHNIVQEIKTTWQLFLNVMGSREAVGETIYGAIFDSAPSLQKLFKTPRAVMAMRFMEGLHKIVHSLEEPDKLKTLVETLGFMHLHLEVTPPRIELFRNAILGCLENELSDMFPKTASVGWAGLLNYTGGAFIYVRTSYASLIAVLQSSWAIANPPPEAERELPEDLGEGQESGFAGAEEVELANGAEHGASRSGKAPSSGEKATSLSQKVPKNFHDMFSFNAAVMGFGGRLWMGEVLKSFDSIVINVANSIRLQEECDVLSLRLANFKEVKFGEFKAVMLAALRSLCPKVWDAEHEAAWSWLWENVQRMLTAHFGKPAVHHAAVRQLVQSLDERSRYRLQTDIYSIFFRQTPVGEDYFKQSNTRLRFIVDRVIDMTLDIFVDPVKMAEDISALGLRHVGYGIPTELFGPFVTACIQALRGLTSDKAVEEAFQWSLSLIARVLVRTISEGSTLVMKAINANSAKHMRKALAIAPRGVRASLMLRVTVGTQSISPLEWALESGALEAARAMLRDLTTIRADRDRYYYGLNDVFQRHANVVQMLCDKSPELLSVFLDGLVWRSRLTEYGKRRVNYYVQHLVITTGLGSVPKGLFARSLMWIVQCGDPKAVCHPAAVFISDLLWQGVAARAFLEEKAMLVLGLIVFMIAQCTLHGFGSQGQDRGRGLLIATALCRAFIYTVGVGRFVSSHVQKVLAARRAPKGFFKLGCVRVPSYLRRWQDVVSLVLLALLLMMLATEPILHCLASPDKGDPLFYAGCARGEELAFTYSVFSSLAVLAYFALLADLAVLSTRLAAFVLIGAKMMGQLILFLVFLLFVTLTFSSGISALDHDHPDFAGITPSFVNLLTLTFDMASDDFLHSLAKRPALLATIFVYVFITVVFLCNMLVAQLTASFQKHFSNMRSFANTQRGGAIVKVMPNLPKRRWERFRDSLRFDLPLEFNEGDVGLSGGIQVLEPASANPTTVDRIRRFGGSTDPKAPWSEMDLRADGADGEDKLDRLNRMLDRALERALRPGRSRSGSPTGSSRSTSQSGSASRSRSDFGDSRSSM